MIVSSPVINQQFNFEKRILEQVCNFYACSESTLAEVKKPSSKLIRVKAGWKLESNQYVFYTFSGLHFPYANQDSKRKKEKFALSIARDLNLLSNEIERIDRLGLSIDWSHFQIKQVNEDGVCEVIFNAFGDATYLELKSIHQIFNPNLLTPWIRKRLVNTQVRLNFEDIDQLFEKYKVN